MAVSQKRSKRKPTGGRYTGKITKTLRQLGSTPSLTKVEKTRKRKLRVLGDNPKMRLLAIDTVNLLDPKDNKHKVVKVKQVLETHANPNYTRRNILTKGAVVETELGKAKITSRPGQEGAVNAVLVK